MGALFGTDGIRGIANAGLDATLAFKVGQAAAIALAANQHKKRPLIMIGKDTRISSDMLEAALTAGICSTGADVIPLGVVPTPAVAYITVNAGADAGIMISASHNPYEYNGIKIFDARGYKLSDELEAEIERMVLGDTELPLARDGSIGRVVHIGAAFVKGYEEKLIRAASGIMGLRVVVDCANGAASDTAKHVFGNLPLICHIMNATPDGVNINNACGSTDIRSLSAEVIRLGYDIGISFDGDADRCIAVDETGKPIDGDKIMAICGNDMMKAGVLRNNTIVATVMSNMGFKKYTHAHGIHIETAQVGDRNVLERMKEIGANLGGEQSGHIIFLDDTTTGDGQLAAIKLLKVVSRERRAVSHLIKEIPQYPQKLTDIAIEGRAEIKEEVLQSPALKDGISAAEQKLGDNGRILIRASGTEALIRVMVEAVDESLMLSASDYLSELVRSLINTAQTRKFYPL